MKPGDKWGVQSGCVRGWYNQEDLLRPFEKKPKGERREEFRELVDIQYRLAQVMQARASIEKEYLMCFAEAEHFHHVHIHFVAKPKDLPQEAKGPGIFAYLNVDQLAAVPPDEIKAFSEELKEALSTGT